MANRSIPERGSWLLREIMYDLRRASPGEWLRAALVVLGSYVLMWVALAWAVM